ncbi:MAG TPA: ABC transporter substrate-binding protein [Solirubrobacteraceae bacterium]|nr:ABC transporter substrate-binding protein [Solirubrobacteraceae bacterium]
MLVIAALAIAACGGSDDDSGSSGSSGAGGVSTGGKPVDGQKKGGHLTVLAASDVDNIDPGQAYYTFTYEVLAGTINTLYSVRPDDDGSNPVPDLADGQPKISDDGKTVTVKIKTGIRYSPPYNKVVTSKDVKYAIERAFTPAVPNGYINSYFAKIVGVQAFTDGKAKEISGIDTPDDNTIVFHLTGGDIVGALVMPVTSPVPEAYARKYDEAKGQSTYGRHQLATGPYMIKSYQPGKSIEVVRNPNWNADKDYKPAYLDSVTFAEGYEDPGVATRRITDGKSQASGDFTIPPDQLKSLAQGSKKDQLIVSPGAGNRYIGVNTTIKPWGNVNVRRALAAVLNRQAMLQVRGGALLGEVANHILYPTVVGFEEAGGLKGAGQDFYAAPQGDLAVAQKYMKLAGYPSGKGSSSTTVLIVGDNTGPAKLNAEIVERAVSQLGFKPVLREVSHSTMISKYCTVPKAKVALCPNLGWAKDFADAGTILDPLYNPKNIVPQGNVVTPQYRGSGIGADIEKAQALPAGKERVEAWAAIDKKVSDLVLNVPYIWDKYPVVASANVQMVNQLWNQGSIDYTWSSLK